LTGGTIFRPVELFSSSDCMVMFTFWLVGLYFDRWNFSVPRTAWWCLYFLPLELRSSLDCFVCLYFRPVGLLVTWMLDWQCLTIWELQPNPCIFSWNFKDIENYSQTLAFFPEILRTLRITAKPLNFSWSKKDFENYGQTLAFFREILGLWELQPNPCIFFWNFRTLRKY